MSRLVTLIFAVAAVLTLGGLAAPPVQAQGQQTVTVYSSRIEQLIKPLFDRYTAETGVQINLLTDRGGAIAERLAAEGAGSPADILLTVDMGNLWSAAERGLLRKIDSPALNANVPANFRDPGDHWWGLSRRERTIFFDPSKVKPEQLSTYEDLAEPKWKGKLCLRTGKQTYTQSLVAMLLVKHGEAKAEQIVRGWVDNLATDVFTNDASLLQAIAAGQCEVGIANTYYYGRLISRDAGIKDKVHLFWANQGKDEGGAHVNLSGGGVTRHAKNPAGAQKLLEWLSSADAQSGYTHGTFESPVNPAVEPDAIIKDWGIQFIPSPLNAAEIGARQPDAIRLLDRVGYR
ncbi:extracellular solute-binding protein [Pseudothauera nasutitermitis]|uniref:Extracellular solute-binding protein n=1 Tax=Pseudothauera nasutitermitis TaxID=2565930 RepID=A0A4S4B3Y8_9RHOO|nr:extracellular solute-binding protein [Pseudothauera nasutitermitis]THF67407.1 extracellular solute-binding protein [Pseudothauera nasutitermitis]